MQTINNEYAQAMVGLYNGATSADVNVRVVRNVLRNDDGAFVNYDVDAMIVNPFRVALQRNGCFLCLAVACHVNLNRYVDACVVCNE